MSSSVQKNNSDSPPPYSAVAHMMPQKDEPMDSTGIIKELCCYMTYRLAIEYDVHDYISMHNRPPVEVYCRYTRLARKYTKLLGDLRMNKTVSDEQVTLANLQHYVFTPAQRLGIPADVMEFVLFSFRCVRKRFGEWETAFVPEAISSAPSLFLLKLMLDYHVLLPKLAMEPQLFVALRDKCALLHRHYYRGLLSIYRVALGDADMVPASVADKNSLRTPGDWPNVWFMFNEAYRPSQRFGDTNLTRDYCVDPRKFKVRNAAESCRYWISRPVGSSQREGAWPVIWLPGGGWWTNPEITSNRKLEGWNKFSFHQLPSRPREVGIHMGPSCRMS